MSDAPNSPAAIRRRHALLGARTRRLATSRKPPPPVASVSCLVCQTDGALYGIPLARVGRIAPFRTASPAPTNNPALIGVAGRSGVFYHVCDLSLLAGASAQGEGGHLVMLRGRQPALALRVDEAVRVADVVELSADAASQMRPAHPVVKGFARALQTELFEGQAISLLDVDQLLSVETDGQI
jgi:chemotaxis signal transduction protein